MRTSAVLLLLALVACSGDPPRPSLPTAEPPAPRIGVPNREPLAADLPSPAPPDEPSTEMVAPATSSDGALIARPLVGAITVDGVLDEPSWNTATAGAIDRDYAGVAVTSPETAVRIVWAPDALYLAFDGSFVGPLTAPDTATDVEAENLYAYDVVELFVDPEPASPGTYRELEFGLRGHALDLAIDRSARPRGDGAWSSGSVHAARVDEPHARFSIEARIPAAAFERATLAPGEWRVGVYRVTGHSPAPRVYLARFPTLTARPSFHVPERFGVLRLRP